MTVFVHAKPLKRGYRKFKIRGLDAPDDYESMRQAVYRRFRRAEDGDEKFTELPDPAAHRRRRGPRSAAEGVLRELGLGIPTFGMVKDDRHRTRALETPDGREIGISGNPAVFAFIGTIQEETHRCAIEYQRSLRSAKLHSTLDAIPGVGGEAARGAAASLRHRQGHKGRDGGAARRSHTQERRARGVRLLPTARRRSNESHNRRGPRPQAARAAGHGRAADDGYGQGGHVQHHPVRHRGQARARPLRRDGPARDRVPLPTARGSASSSTRARGV